MFNSWRSLAFQLCVSYVLVNVKMPGSSISNRYGVPDGTKSHAQSSNHFFNYTIMLFINKRSYM